MAEVRDDVTIREFAPDDAVEFVRLAADRRVTRHVGDGSPWNSARALERVRAAFLSENRWYSVVVDDHRWAGVVVLERMEDAAVEFGIWVHPDFWGGGVARRAGELALGSLLVEHPATTVVAHVAPDNLASRALMAALGLVHRADVVSRYGTPVGRFERQP